jgi:hypothetical protein
VDAPRKAQSVAKEEVGQRPCAIGAAKITAMQSGAIAAAQPRPAGPLALPAALAEEESGVNRAFYRVRRPAYGAA